MIKDKWDERFFEMASQVSSWSKDSKKVGCVIVKDRRILSTGYNGFPPGVSDSAERLENKSLKRLLVQHAEANAVSHAARQGVSLEGSTAYVTRPCCSQCMGLLVCAGVSEIKQLQLAEGSGKDWTESFQAADIIASESDIVTKTVEKT